MSSALSQQQQQHRHRPKTRLGQRRRRLEPTAGILLIALVFVFTGGPYFWAVCGVWEQSDLILPPSSTAAKTRTTTQQQLAVPYVTTTTTTTMKKKDKTPPIVIHAPYDGPLARVFPKYPRELPCFPDPQHDYRWRPEACNKGMYYAKLPKC
jgi:hypothetical protein